VMKAADLNSRLSSATRKLAWSQWSALGVSAAGTPTGGVAVDLEALILLTLEVGRDEPRLFDEALDWCHRNHELISTTRLSNACVDEVDHRLVDALLAWLSAHGRGARRAQRAPEPTSAAPGTLLFPSGAALLPSERDPAFAAFGFDRPVLNPSGKSRNPDLLAPECLSLRLRTLFGSGAKPDVVATLLSTDAPRVQFAVIQAAAGFSAKRVLGALDDLADAGVVQTATAAGQEWYSIDRAAWAGVLGVEESELPRSRDWLQLLAAYRQLVRWLRDADDRYPTPYLRAGAAREVWADVEPGLRFSGVRIRVRPFAPGEAYWADFAEAVSDVARHAEAVAGGW